MPAIAWEGILSLLERSQDEAEAIGRTSMKLSFTGWSRVVVRHEHPVRPLVSGRLQGKDESLVFKGLTASGKVSGVGLTGDFRVTVELSPGDLKSALDSYVKASPADALRLLAAAHAEAVIALAHPVALKA